MSNSFIVKIKNSSTIEVYDDKKRFIRTITIRDSDGLISSASFNGNEFVINTNKKNIIYDDKGRWKKEI